MPATSSPTAAWTYDYTKFEPELAESWELAPDGKSVTFHLRKDATFHDGTPVTAKDVKWSFDRAVAVGGFPAIQMGAREMTSPDQFVVVDDHTFRVDFPRPNKLILPNLAVPIAKIDQLGARQEERHRGRPLGARMGRQERRRQRRLHGRELEAGQRDRLQALRRLEVGPAALLHAVSSAARSPRPAPAARSSRRATPTSPSTCRPRTSPSWPRPASSRSSARRSTPSSSTST